MCVSSVIHQYGQRYPDPYWNQQNWPPFRDLLDKAKQVDEQLGEPHCIDPEKDAWARRIEDRIRKLEESELMRSFGG